MTKAPLVVHVARDVANTGGGEVVKQLCRGMAARGLVVRLVTDTPADELELPGVVVTSTTLGRELLAWAPKSKVGWTMRHAAQILLFSVMSSVVVLPYRLRGALVFNHNCESLLGQVLVMHNVFSAELERRRLGRLETMRAYLNPVRAMRIIKERVLARTGQRTLVAVSEAAASDAIDLAGDFRRVVTIANGVDLDYYSPDVPSAAPSDAFLRWKEAGHITHVITFIGHEFKRKGLFDLISALSLIPAHVGLVVIGGASEPLDHYRHRLRTGALAGRVLYMGEVDDVRPYLGRSHLLCLPSYYESMGLVGLEALASGVPIVVASGLPVARYVIPGVNGALCDHDPASIAHAVLTVLTEVGSNPRAVASTVATRGWADQIESYVALVRRLERSGVHAE